MNDEKAGLPLNLVVLTLSNSFKPICLTIKATSSPRSTKTASSFLDLKNERKKDLFIYTQRPLRCDYYSMPGFFARNNFRKKA